MDFASHRALESVVDEALPLDRSLTLELQRNDDGSEMTAAVAHTRVSDMKMTLVDHFDVDCGESLA